nr:squalene/phytoene synthase family protein [Chloroflexota bacterium]
RAADTISDRKHSGLRGSRLEGLETLRTQVAGPAELAVLQKLASDSADTMSTPGERALFASLVESFSLLESLDTSDLEQVRWLVGTLTQGMEMDLNVFPGQDSRHLTALATAEELDRYTYLVAGCVGEFWTNVAIAHEPSLAGWDVPDMSQWGVRFGKALQLTNILRDIPGDLRMGRCYLPADELAAARLNPGDLLDQANETRAREVLIPWVQTALGHFEAAEEYLLAIPRRSVRLRLACLWPLLLGLATLARLTRSKEWLHRDSSIKVSRRWVYLMMLKSLPAVTSDRLLRRWIKKLRDQVESAI